VPPQALFAHRLRRMTNAGLRARLEAIGAAFTAGYQAALEEREPAAIAARLDRVEPERQGFAAEGVGMGLALLDGLAPGRSGRRDRLRRYLEGPGEQQSYMLHAGAGWALAFPFLSGRALLARLDPLLGAIALDGYGFYRAYFFPRRTIDHGRLPRWISGAASRSFDVGVGRRLWFLDTETERLPALAAAFPEDRRADLWAGLGEACSFGGGREAGTVAALHRAAGPFLPAFAQGIAFAAEARDRGGIPAEQTELACRTVWERSAADTAAVVRDTRPGLPGTGPAAFEAWRRRIRERFTSSAAPASAPPRGRSPS